MSEAIERTPDVTSGASSRHRGRLPLKQALLGMAGAVGLAAAAHYGVHYWEVGRFQVETDDAYVQADSIIIAPRVAGYIAQVLVNDIQPVRVGQVLARIDERDLRTALDQAVADREAGAQKVANLGAQLHLQQSLIEEAQARLASSQAAATFAAQDQKRYSDLARTGAGSIQQAQQSQSLLFQRAADLQRAQATLTSAQQQVEVLRTAEAEAQAVLAHAEAVEHEARLNLGYATIVAPEDGTVGAHTLRVGQYVQAGTQLMAIVPLHAVYVVANYKETQLTDVRPGQPVDIAIDTFPDHTVHGVVDSIAPASGQEFALLPPDNATGNFTKIVQRIPVKITLNDGELAGILRPGMSVEPTINTRGG